MTSLRVENDDRGVATLTVDHPPINLVTMDVFFELGAAIEALANDKSVRAVVIRSANPEWFLAHFDVEAIQQFPREQPEPTAIGPYDVMCETLRTMPKPTIAVIAGRVGGGGSELALACDMRFATPDAIFSQPEVALGIIPAAGGVARRLRYNTPRMNSWHSWSSNSRWLVFSSKVNTPYTQLFLTHIDENGNDSPPVLLERFTSPDRAANSRRLPAPPWAAPRPPRRRCGNLRRQGGRLAEPAPVAPG